VPDKEEAGVKYGMIASGSVVNEAIYQCFERIPEKEARKFVRRFAEQPHEGVQVMHTFRELIAGAFLAQQGYEVESDPIIDGKTPDWSFKNDCQHGLLELVNLHADKKTETEVTTAMRKEGSAFYWMGSNVDRLYPRIWDKARAYKKIVETLRLSYVVCVFGEFIANVTMEEVQECVSKREDGLFQMYPCVSGVLFFMQGAGQYFFEYTPNPSAAKPCELPAGVLDLRPAKQPLPKDS
jgi:hypothetical protein